MDLLPQGHHSSAATRHEYSETWEKRKSTLLVPLQQNHRDSQAVLELLTGRFWPGPFSFALLERLQKEGSEVMTGPFLMYSS